MCTGVFKKNIIFQTNIFFGQIFADKWCLYARQWHHLSFRPTCDRHASIHANSPDHCQRWEGKFHTKYKRPYEYKGASKLYLYFLFSKTIFTSPEYGAQKRSPKNTNHSIICGTVFDKKQLWIEGVSLSLQINSAKVIFFGLSIKSLLSNIIKMVHFSTFIAFLTNIQSFSGTYSTLVVSFHLQRHMGDFVIQVASISINQFHIYYFQFVNVICGT